MRASPDPQIRQELEQSTFTAIGGLGRPRRSPRAWLLSQRFSALFCLARAVSAREGRQDRVPPTQKSVFETRELLVAAPASFPLAVAREFHRMAGEPLKKEIKLHADKRENFQTTTPTLLPCRSNSNDRRLYPPYLLLLLRNRAKLLRGKQLSPSSGALEKTLFLFLSFAQSAFLGQSPI